MPIEIATYISELNPLNPLGTDKRSTSDDHHRLQKTVLQNQFHNFSATSVDCTVAELNILDGATVTTAELNLLTGLTSLPQSELGTPVSCSGAGPISISGIPSWAKTISITLEGVGTNDPFASLTLRIGDSGGYSSSLYRVTTGQVSGTPGSSTSTINIPLQTDSGALFDGTVTLSLHNATTYKYGISGDVAMSVGGKSLTIGGSVTLTGLLDGVQILTSSGVFDKGTMNVLVFG